MIEDSRDYQKTRSLFLLGPTWRDFREKIYERGSNIKNEDDK